MILFTLLIDVDAMIKWKKWILELLPTSKRTLMMYALCIVLASPIIKLYGEFMEWRTRMRIKSGATPQTCMLRQIIKDELGIDVLIEEGNGKPTDFIIKTSFVNVDMERRLFALLDRYKLAGKSYGYENAEIEMHSVWSGYLCEKITSNVITVTLYYEGEAGDKYPSLKKFTIQSELPVKSDLNIHIDFFFFIYEDDKPGYSPVDIPFTAGSSYIEMPETWDFAGYTTANMTPNGDDKFDYVLKVIEKYGYVKE